MARLGIRPGLPPILDRVSPDKRQPLAQAIARAGLPLPLLDRMETWAAAMTLLSLQFKALGLQGSDGVESTLRENFAAANKPVGELETNAEQLGYFDALPEAAQRSLLESAIDSPEGMRAQFGEMVTAWSRGDTAAIAKSFNAEYGDTPALLDSLLRQRNAHWAQWIAARMGQPGTVMVAVGAGHLAGDSSVQSLLERRGYKVRRLQ
jgi:uncharacterized protein YbaP (TraB family)